MNLADADPYSDMSQKLRKSSLESVRNSGRTVVGTRLEWKSAEDN